MKGYSKRCFLAISVFLLLFSLVFPTSSESTALLLQAQRQERVSPTTTEQYSYQRPTGYGATDDAGWLKYYRPHNSFEVGFSRNTIDDYQYGQSCSHSFTLNIRYTGQMDIGDREIKNSTVSVSTDRKYDGLDGFAPFRQAAYEETGVWPVETTVDAPCPFCCCNTVPAYSSFELEKDRRSVKCAAILCGVLTFGIAICVYEICYCFCSEYEETLEKRNVLFQNTIFNMYIAKGVKEADELVDQRIAQPRGQTLDTAAIIAQLMANPELLRQFAQQTA